MKYSIYIGSKMGIIFAVISLSLATAIEDKFLGEKIETGSYIIKGESSLFYMLAKARTPKADPPPLLIWLTGGPGCSGMYAPFGGVTGPFNLTDDEDPIMSLVDYSWTIYYDMIFIDQPLGVGYSHEAREEDLCNSVDCNAKDIVVFLNKFAYAHPHYSSFYIAGVSFSGETIPKVGEYLIKSKSPLKLEGILVGNGWTDPINQVYGMPNYAYEHKLISLLKYIISYGCFGISKMLIWMGFESTADQFVDNFCYDIITKGADWDLYNILGTDYGPSATTIINFLGEPDNRAFLNTTERPYFEGMDSTCNQEIYLRYVIDEVTSVVPSIQYLLESNVKILLFAGDLDFMCSWNQMEDWINRMEWPGQERYLSMGYKQYVLNGETIGRYKMVDNLAFYIIHNAGHAPTIEQPAGIWNLLNKVVDGSLYDEQ